MAKEKKEDLYLELGVQSDKSEVGATFEDLCERVFQYAFCNIGYLPDVGYYIKHPDGSGSKSILRLLCFLETGESEYIVEDLFDALGMNTGDAGACGFFEIFIMSNIVGINADNAKKSAILMAIREAFIRLKKQYREFGIILLLAAGETADLPNQINSYVLDVDVFTYLQDRQKIITGEVMPGDVIFGFASSGKALFEDCYNSGIMSNGLTLGQTVLMHKDYAKKYPFLTRESKPYQGRYYLDDYVDSIGMTVGEALLSPTRQWVFVIKMLVEELMASGNFDLLHGITMNTGGGATKILNIGSGIHYSKKMPEPDPIFQLIQAESGQDWEHMFTSFNCGIGLDVIGNPKGGILERAVRTVSKKCNIKCYDLGECLQSSSGRNEVGIKTPYGEFPYLKS